MLTADLVLVRMYRGEVRPRYIDSADEELLALAEQLIDLFTEHEGRPRHELSQELRELVGTGTDFLLHRSLAKLLFDRCSFDTESSVDPEVLRFALFAASAEAFRAAGHDEEGKRVFFDRQQVVEQVADSLELRPEELERGLYADLKEEQILQDWRPCKPRWLLDRYNVALAQGVLLRATELEIRLTEPSATRQRELFRKIKFFRLLHRVSRKGDGSYRIHLDGPLSVFRSSGKYGVQMASFLPTLLHFENWTLQASVLWGKKRRPCTFALSSGSDLEPYNRLTGQWQPEELQWLPEQLAKLSPEWETSREADLQPLGGQGILIPDFVFRHRESGTEVFMEVLGFWRKGAVRTRLETLQKLGPSNMILAISKQLVTEADDLDELPGEVYVFRSTPIARQVLRLLEKIRVGQRID